MIEQKTKKKVKKKNIASSSTKKISEKPKKIDKKILENTIDI